MHYVVFILRFHTTSFQHASLHLMSFNIMSFYKYSSTLVCYTLCVIRLTLCNLTSIPIKFFHPTLLNTVCVISCKSLNIKLLDAE